MSNWYGIQCVSGKEGIVRDNFQKLFHEYSTFLPRRALEIRKKGNTSVQIKALFPGYFFIKTSTRLIYREALDFIKKVNQMHSTALILKVVGMHKKNESLGSDEISPIQNEEMQLFLDITDKDEVVQFSRYKKEGDRIQIINGPLAGHEGIILKMNSRKKRVKVSINLFGKEQVIDLGAEMIV